jgi:GH25 family lysozyme M1 (1,4-beta-N-acetylmuramidase)
LTYAIGEDRSAYQSVSSWGNNAFGICKFTEADDFIDPAATENWANLKAEGKVRGAYHFFHPAASPLVQAEFFVSTVLTQGGFGPGDMFILDSELSLTSDGSEVPHPGTRRMSVPLLRMSDEHQEGADRASLVGTSSLAFLERVASLVGAQCPVLLYSYLDMACTQLANCVRWPLYVADYSSVPPDVSPWPRWVIWQYADSGGYGGGDADYFNGDAAQLQAWLDTYTGGWTEALVRQLPTLKLGDQDVEGAPFQVHLMQAIVAGRGKWIGLGSVTQISAGGRFDTATKVAVQALQRHYGIAEDGICGPVTWTHLLNV